MDDLGVERDCYILNSLLTHGDSSVVKACISMTFPPRLQEIPLQNSQFSEDGDSLPEVVPPFPLAPSNVQYDLVHFDMDPNNVFIGETDNDHVDISLFHVGTPNLPFCV